MNPKPVLIISNYDDIHNPYYAGGGAVLTSFIASSLASKFRVTVITGRYPGSHDQVVSEVTYRRIGLKFGGPKLGQIVYHLLLPFYALTLSYDLWVESFTPPISTSFLPLFTRRPIIGWVHSLTGEDMTRKYKLPFILIERLGLKFYRRVIVPTTFLCAKITRINPAVTAVVIPHGIPRRQVTTLASRVKPRHLLYVGRIAYYEKGLDLLLEAYTRIPLSVRVPLVIAGGGPASEIRRLKAHISRLRLDSAVRLVGVVTPARRRRLLNSSYALAFPSRFETFGLVALETFAAGIPVVAFDLPGLSWIPSDCALKAPAFSVSAFSLHLTRLISEARLRSALAGRGKRLSSRFILEELPAKYQAVLNQILSSQKISR